jgi:uncharacterized protein involved in type VI secretion and phage assembly
MVPYTYLANVVENVDPDGFNRVRVKVHGEEERVAEWVPIGTLYASDGSGMSFLPDVGDQVLVTSFLKDNTQKVVVGTVWSNPSPPPETNENPDADLNSDGKNSLRHIKSRSGNQMIFDDGEREEKIQLISADEKSRIEFSVADEVLFLTTEHDITIGSKGVLSIQAEEVEITSDKEVNMQTDEYQVQAEKEHASEADNGISIEGSGVSLN